MYRNLTIIAAGLLMFGTLAVHPANADHCNEGVTTALVPGAGGGTVRSVAQFYLYEDGSYRAVYRESNGIAGLQTTSGGNVIGLNPDSCGHRNPDWQLY